MNPPDYQASPDTSVTAVIPARFRSSRLPGKPLAEIHGVPMVVRVAQRVADALGTDGTVIATDDSRIAAAAAQAGFRSVLTSDDCATGSDRVSHASDILGLTGTIMNIQGDEPMILPVDIRRVLEYHIETASIATNAYAPLSDGDDPANRSIPKMVHSDGRLLYASRSPVPGSKTGATVRYDKQVCIYAFDANLLRSIYGPTRTQGPVEAIEDIEILRVVEAGLPVSMVQVSGDTYSVDTPSDLDRVRGMLAPSR